MDYYIDILIRPNPEISDSIMMNEVYFRLHKVLGNIGQGKVGVSFPKFNKTLGNCLRLHSSKEIIQQVMSTSWTKEVEDYIKVSNVTKIPEIVSYRMVQRVQLKSNIERLLRRSVRKGWLTEEEAELRLTDAKEKRTKLPFVRIQSLSTNQLFCLFIEHTSIVTNSQSGEFTAYGLSSNATIPWF